MLQVWRPFLSERDSNLQVQEDVSDFQPLSPGGDGPGASLGRVHMHG